MNKQPILWYFADPMCSWCWGFSPVIKHLHARYSKRLNVALMLGGLRPGTKEPLSDTMRGEILHHWHEVHRMTGQPFSFDGTILENFVYDTEPASRAVISLAQQDATNTLPYFRTIQTAFYVNQLDVTNAEQLLELAKQYDIDADRFMMYFNSEEARQKTLQHFHGARQAGVTGFPTLVLQTESGHEYLTRGYKPYDELIKSIETTLAA